MGEFLFLTCYRGNWGNIPRALSGADEKSALLLKVYKFPTILSGGISLGDTGAIQSVPRRSVYLSTDSRQTPSIMVAPAHPVKSVSQERFPANQSRTPLSVFRFCSVSPHRFPAIHSLYFLALHRLSSVSPHRFPAIHSIGAYPSRGQHGVSQERFPVSHSSGSR